MHSQEAQVFSFGHNSPFAFVLNEQRTATHIIQLENSEVSRCRSFFCRSFRRSSPLFRFPCLSHLTAVLARPAQQPRPSARLSKPSAANCDKPFFLCGGQDLLSSYVGISITRPGLFSLQVQDERRSPPLCMLSKLLGH